MNISKIDELPIQGQVLLNNLIRIDPLLRTIGLQNKQMQNSTSKNITFESIAFAFIFEEMGYALANNFTSTTLPGCDGGKYNFNLKCNKEMIDGDSIIIQKPQFYQRAFTPFVTISLCQKMIKYNQMFKMDILTHVLCQEVKLESLKNYFQNYAKSSVQAYLIEPISQIVIFDSTKPFDKYGTKSLSELEFNYLQSQIDVQIFNNTLKQNFKSQIYEKVEKINKSQPSSLDKLDIEFEYNRNGTNNHVIINPIYLIDKIPQFVGVQNALPKMYNIQLVLAQINIISNEFLEKYSEELQLFFNKYYLGYLIMFSCIAIISLLISIIYSIKITRLFNNPNIHLTDLLKRIELQKSNSELQTILANSLENSYIIFLSYETKELYQSFQDVFKLLVFTNDNFFFGNEGETLIKLNKQIEFFIQFKNDYAVGISHNNIGSILLKQGHYFQALEHFQTSIIYAKYEIQSFLSKNPDLMNVKQIQEYSLYQNQQNNVQIKNECLQNKTYFKNNSFLNNLNQENMQITISPKFEKNCETLKSSLIENIIDIKDGYININKQKLNIDSSLQTKNDNIEQNLSPPKGFINQQNKTEQFGNQSEERIKLISNLFYRQQNFITTLIAFQENCDNLQNNNQISRKCFNFWKEIKSLIKRQIYLGQQLPFGNIEIVELLGNISKCYFNQYKFEKAKTALMNSEKYLKNLQTISSQDQGYGVNDSANLENKNNQKSKQEYQVIQTLKINNQNEQNNHLNLLLTLKNQQIYQESPQNGLSRMFQYLNNDKGVNIKPFIENINIISRYSFLQENLFNQRIQKSNNFLQNGNNERITNQNGKDNQKYIISSIFEDYEVQSKTRLYNQTIEYNETEQQRLFEKESHNVLLPQKQIKNTIKINSKSNVNRFQNKLNQQNKINQNAKIQILNFQQSYEEHKRNFMRQQNKINSLNYNNIFEAKELLINYIKSEYFIKTEKYLEAALTLTSLLENYKILMSHFPYKITNLLKKTLDTCNIKLKEFEDFNQKFNQNIQMNVAIIYSYKREKHQNQLQSVQLFTQLVIQILNCQKDKIGVLIYNYEENILQNYMSLINIPQIFQFIDQIAQDILNFIYIQQQNPHEFKLNVSSKQTLKRVSEVRDKLKISEYNDNLYRNNSEYKNNNNVSKNNSLINSQQNQIYFQTQILNYIVINSNCQYKLTKLIVCLIINYKVTQIHQTFHSVFNQKTNLIVRMNSPQQYKSKQLSIWEMNQIQQTKENQFQNQV